MYTGFSDQGPKAPETPYKEERTMDIARELLAINRCLRSPEFRTGEMVRHGDGRVGVVQDVRILILASHCGNEYRVRWENGETEWLDGSLLSSSAQIGGRQQGVL